MEFFVVKRCHISAFLRCSRTFSIFRFPCLFFPGKYIISATDFFRFVFMTGWTFLFNGHPSEEKNKQTVVMFCTPPNTRFPSDTTLSYVGAHIVVTDHNQAC